MAMFAHSAFVPLQTLEKNIDSERFTAIGPEAMAHTKLSILRIPCQNITIR